MPAPAAGTLTELLADAGDTVHGRPGHRAHDDPVTAPTPAKAAPKPEPTETRPRRSTPRRSARPTASRSRRSPRASPPRRASTSRACTGTGPNGRIGKADVLALRENGAEPLRRRRRRRAGRRHADAAQGRERDARALHGRVAGDPDRDLVPHLHRHDPRRPPQAAQGGRPARLLHAPDRARDRARGHRADAGDGPPLRRDRRQAARHRRRARSTSASPSTSRRRAAGAR